MKTTKITYWTVTILFALLMIFSAYSYFTDPTVKEGFAHLGFPDYFRVELGIAKVIGAVLLLIPLSGNVKEWVYAGFTITFISAFIGHTVTGDPLQYAIMPLLFLIPLAISYFTYHRLQAGNLSVTTSKMTL